MTTSNHSWITRLLHGSEIQHLQPHEQEQARLRKDAPAPIRTRAGRSGSVAMLGASKLRNSSSNIKPYGGV